MLKNNWRWAKLGEVSDVIMGQSPSGDETTDNPAYIPLIGGASDMGELLPMVTRYTKVPTKLSQVGDVIICVRATLGRPIYSDSKYCLGRGVAAIRSDILTKEFIRYYLLRNEQYLYDNAAGSTFLQITSTQLRDMPIPVPSLEEQKRIVNLIESLFGKLDRARVLAQSVVDNYELRRSAILHKAFAGELIPVVSQSMKINAVCKSLIYGTSKKSSEFGKVIVIRMGNLQNGEIDWTNLAYTDDEEDIEKYTLSAGDILFNRTNSAELVGKTSIYRGGYSAIYAGYLIKLDYDHKILIGDYLNYMLNSPEAKDYCRRVKTDGVNQSNINAKKIGAFEIPIPNIEEQKEIVRILDSLLAKEQRTKELAEQVLQKIDLMKKAILARAFKEV